MAGAVTAARPAAPSRVPRVTADGADASRWPRTILVSGRRVLTAAGPSRAPGAGPADEMLDRLWGAVGHNGLVMLGPEEPSWDYLLTDAGAWTISSGNERSVWFTASRGQTRLRLVRSAGIVPGNDPLLGPDELATVSRHQRFMDLLGVPFFADGGATGALLMEETIRVKGSPPLRAWRNDDAPAVTEVPWLGPWSVPEYGQAVRLDRNAHYLGPANSVLLACDGLQHTAGRPDPRLHVGYWHIRTPANPEPRLPHPMGAGAQPGAWRWVTHPTMDLLDSMSITLEIDNSWTCPRDRARRLLVPWYERIRDARSAVADYSDDDGRALQLAIKDTYSRGIGCLNRPTRRWFRPDWRAALYAEARCAMYRAVRRAVAADSAWPVETATDSVFYEGRVPASFKVGTGMGEWKVLR